ncbi:hypothetical protein QWJ34_10660 [Saccharibacillus sp. CPCC 101409]|uniref:hypothetical protein n=1 Tax=Saccharibacillus sp. CPCC 101409 TaxID=3058041 RepID=UPI0026718EDD|nr:hypothetical protein [Saccharibacillus sp. CPCC 101409]MDO3410222.1 hypothetical protein [Saccharibacillus sp. CPCC 101409]
MSGGPKLSRLQHMELQAETLFVHDDSLSLVRINEYGGGEAPAFFFGDTPEGSVLRLRPALGAACGAGRSRSAVQYILGQCGFDAFGR